MTFTPRNTPAPLIGTAVGDSLGMPFEKFPPYHPALLWWDGKMTNCSPSHPFNSGLQKGQWTDDTQMSVALARSLVDSGCYNELVTLHYYLGWFRGTPAPRVVGALEKQQNLLAQEPLWFQGSAMPRGVGGTIKKALVAAQEHLEKTGALKPCGIHHHEIAGNGVVMRLSPLSVWLMNCVPPPVHLDIITAECSLTHCGPDSISSAMRLHNALIACHKCTNYQWLEREIGRGDFAIGQPTTDVNTVLRAIACLMSTSSFTGAVQAAVRLGDDTDTVAAITGALAGIWYGLEDIPSEYLRELEDYDAILQLQEQLYRLKLPT